MGGQGQLYARVPLHAPAVPWRTASRVKNIPQDATGKQGLTVGGELILEQIPGWQTRS